MYFVSLEAAHQVLSCWEWSNEANIVTSSPHLQEQLVVETKEERCVPHNDWSISNDFVSLHLECIKAMVKRFFLRICGKRQKWVLFFMSTWTWLGIFLKLFSLCVLFSHFRPRDATLGNSFFQTSSYALANERITYEKRKGKLPWEYHVVWNGKTKRTSQKGPLKGSEKRLMA